MKLLIIAFLAVIWQTGAYNPLLALRRAGLYSASPLQYGCVKNQPGITCKDCHTIARCDSAGRELMAAACTDFSGDKTNEFCSIHSRSCVKADTCANNNPDEPTMECQYAGLFPDPMSCNRFLVCDGSTEKAVRYACPGNARFDFDRQTCSGLNIPCRVYSTGAGGLCAGKTFDVLPLPNANLYVVCPMQGFPAVLQSCPNPTERFDPKTFTCSFTCSGEGFFHHQDPAMYYSCVREGLLFKAYEQTCAEGTVFSTREWTNRNFCVKSEEEESKSQ